MSSKAVQSVLDAVYALWLRMGIPENLQVDNELAFYGSPTHPRGMGSLIRFCLHYGVHLWFIPLSEPWRNGVVEKFNDHYQQRFLDKVPLSSMSELRQASLAFEHRHNSTYRYSKLKGKTPLKAFADMEKKLVFPSKSHTPRHPLDKPEEGCYHLVRFIRSDCRLNIFGEIVPAPPETQYEYVVATIDVKEQRLKLFWKRTPLPVVDLPGLRPTPDRVRETLFNWLAHLRPDTASLRGLDLFAGTGALGYELASRGARSVMLVESNAQVLQALQATRARLDAREVEVVAGDAFTVAARLPAAAFDIVFLDPPFDGALQAPALVAPRRLLAPEGLIYLEAPAPVSAKQLDEAGLDLVRTGRAGKVAFHLLRIARA